jgi:hypothetical protein
MNQALYAHMNNKRKMKKKIKVSVSFNILLRKIDLSTKIYLIFMAERNTVKGHHSFSS